MHCLPDLLYDIRSSTYHTGDHDSSHRATHEIQKQHSDNIKYQTDCKYISLTKTFYQHCNEEHCKNLYYIENSVDRLYQISVT